MASHRWLDALNDGRILRDLLSLGANFLFGLIWLILLAGGYALGIGLSLVLIGIPFLMFVLSSTRTLAAMDYQMTAAILGEKAHPLHDDLDMRGANLGERLGMLLGSKVTWLSLLYLLLKLPVGMLSLAIMFCMLPLLIIEIFILAPLTLDIHMLSVRLLHFTTTSIHKGMGLLLPKRRAKRTEPRQARDTNRYQTPRRLYEDDSYEDYEDTYRLGDDGEIELVRKRG